MTKGRVLGNFCSSCHGTNGAAVSEAVPSIAGQHKEYLRQAMLEMRPVVDKDKNDITPRYSTLMKIFMKGYTDEEIELMAAYYSSREWENTNNKPNKKLIKVAKNLKDTEGKPLLDTCIACHYANGNNEDDTGIPRIGGQNALYLKHAMLEFKDSKRKGQRASEMDVVKDLTVEEIEALAEYFAHVK